MYYIKDNTIFTVHGNIRVGNTYPTYQDAANALREMNNA